MTPGPTPTGGIGEPDGWIAVVIATAALVVSVFSAWYTRSQAREARRANDLREAQNLEKIDIEIVPVGYYAKTWVGDELNIGHEIRIHNHDGPPGTITELKATISFDQTTPLVNVKGAIELRPEIPNSYNKDPQMALWLSGSGRVFGTPANIAANISESYLVGFHFPDAGVAPNSGVQFEVKYTVITGTARRIEKCATIKADNETDALSW